MIRPTLDSEALSELRRRLRAADSEPVPGDEEASLRRLAARIRTLPAPRSETHRFSSRLATASVLALAAAVALLSQLASRRPHLADDRQPVPIVPTAPSAGGASGNSRRVQLQFETPGGTRVVWTLDSEFSL